MGELSKNFKTCARDIIREAAGEEPPADCYTGLLEMMIQEIVKPSGRVPEAMTLNAIRACGSPRELSDQEIRTVIGRHFDLK